MLEALVRDLGDRVFRFIGRMVGRSWAEDLTQETFLRAARAVGQYRGGQRTAWIFSIANAVCVDFLRRRKIEVEKMRTIAHESGVGEAPPLERLARAEERERLRRAVGELPLEQRQVLLLREEGEMTFREIAESLRCPLGTVLARMRYAIANLKKKELVHELLC